MKFGIPSLFFEINISIVVGLVGTRNKMKISIDYLNISNKHAYLLPICKKNVWNLMTCGNMYTHRNHRSITKYYQAMSKSRPLKIFQRDFCFTLGSFTKIISTLRNEKDIKDYNAKPK